MTLDIFALRPLLASYHLMWHKRPRRIGTIENGVNSENPGPVIHGPREFSVPYWTKVSKSGQQGVPA